MGSVQPANSCHQNLIDPLTDTQLRTDLISSLWEILTVLPYGYGAGYCWAGQRLLPSYLGVLSEILTVLPYEDDPGFCWAGKRLLPLYPGVLGSHSCDCWAWWSQSLRSNMGGPQDPMFSEPMSWWKWYWVPQALEHFPLNLYMAIHPQRPRPRKW